MYKCYDCKAEIENNKDLEQCPFCKSGDFSEIETKLELKLIKSDLIYLFGDVFNLMREYNQDKIRIKTIFAGIIDNLNKDKRISNYVTNNVVLKNDGYDLFLQCEDEILNIN